MSKKSAKASEMTFFDHLDELRGALLRVLIGVFAALILCYYFAPRLQELLTFPMTGKENTTMALLAPTEGFIVRLKISLVAGIFLSAPWSFYQLWRFVAPGLFKNERRMVLPVVFFSTLCFVTGAVFAVYLLPYATQFFLSFATPTVANAWSLGKYIDFVLRLFLAFGLVFEMPLLIFFLAKFGIVTPPFLRKYRRHMYVVFLISASIITPPDIFTQVVLCAPMIVLYEFSIYLAMVAKKGREKKEEKALQKEKEPDSDLEGEGN